MKTINCDRCGVGIDHANRVHVYNYTIRVYGAKKKVNRPRRDDFDLCNPCRKKLLTWFEFKNPEGKK